MKDLNIAYIQTNLFWEDKTNNLKNLSRLLDQVHPDSNLILLPETFNTAFPVDPTRFAEPEEDSLTIDWMRQQAKDHYATIAGTLLTSKDGSYHNTLVWMRPDGKFYTYYKRHPFSIGGEDKLVERGQESLIVNINGWRIKTMVCYDVRFPVWARNHYRDGQYDYDAAIYLANFPDSRMVVWNTLLVARAIENQAYIIGVNRIGDDPNGLHYSGESQVVDARGNVISKIAPYEEGVAHCSLSYEKLDSFRKKFPLGPDGDSFTLNVCH